MTYRLLPVAKNQILVMFTNLADVFDIETREKGAQKVDLESFSKSLYKKVNKKNPDVISIEQMDV